MRKTKEKPSAVTLMTEAEMQTEASQVIKAMLDKAMPKPEFGLTINGNDRVNAHMCWYPVGTSIMNRPFESFYGDTAQEVFEKAVAFICAQPTAEQAKFNAFMQAVATAVDIGRQNGIDVEFVNPLAETMKRLSENALTFQGAS